MKINTHVILISSQPVPNLTPVLDERFRPQRVIMLVSDGMQTNAAALENVYRPIGIKVERYPVADPWDIMHISQLIESVVLEHLDRHPGEGIALNATGGTKLMSMAAFDIFRQLDLPIFYVHPEQDRLIWLHPEKSTVDLTDRIKLREYLIAYGATDIRQIHKTGVESKIRELTATLVQHIRHYAPALGSLNYLAAQAENAQLRSPDIGRELNSNHNFWALVELFEHAGLVSKQGSALVFAEENARFIVNGGWLELHAYACCLNLKKQLNIQDVSRGIEVERTQGARKVLNELDVALLKNNRLHLLECKTKRYSGQNIKHDEGAEVLYKLDSLKDLLGGLQARAMLVSFRELNKHNKARADELKIDYCCHHDLKFLQEKLHAWLDR